eukprot:3660407-Pyramimonas_sp.AAC.1
MFLESYCFPGAVASTSSSPTRVRSQTGHVQTYSQNCAQSCGEEKRGAPNRSSASSAIYIGSLQP